MKRHGAAACGVLTRAILPGEHQAFALFERDNRSAYERFNEPNPDDYYTASGLHRAFDELLRLEQLGGVLTRAATHAADRHWLGRGSLVMGAGDLLTPPLLAYQTDHRHLGQGVATALLAELIETVRALRLPCVDAVVTEDNTVSRHMLVRHGFQCVGGAEPAVLRRRAASCLLFRLVF